MHCAILTMNFTAPTPPQSAQIYMPENTENFSDGVIHILKIAISKINPPLAQAAQICLALIAVTVLISLLNSFSGPAKNMAQLVGVISTSAILIQPSQSLINLGIQTVVAISEYGKLLLPVMTTALAAQGSAATSTALYSATAIFSTILTTVVSKLIVPMIYTFLALKIANSMIKQDILASIAKFIKWAMTWILKIVLYVFTGYISITGVISGTVDAAAIKATKITLNGAVPIVGSIISEASETILVSAGLIKNSVGVFGMLATISIWIEPFLQIALQYLLLKVTGAICSTFGKDNANTIIADFTTVMGFLLASTGVMCLLVLISTVCFMRSVAA